MDNEAKKIKVLILADTLVRDKLMLNEGEQFDAYDYGDFIYIDAGDDGIVKAPKSEIDGILEIL